MKRIIFFDTEVGVKDQKIHDIGAVTEDDSVFHSSSVSDFLDYIDKDCCLCGHNIIHHDIEYLEKQSEQKILQPAVDTLYLSPLLFPERPYHALLKDDKLQSDELNNPVSDSQKARILFYDEVNAYRALPDDIRVIYYNLLYNIKEFKDFFEYTGMTEKFVDLPSAIKSVYHNKICRNADLQPFIQNYSSELAYALALINTKDHYSITPPWLTYNFPQIENIIKCLRNVPCHDCEYCKNRLDIHRGLKNIFGYSEFRTYDGEPLQENAAQAAMDGKSLLAVFPTGGGKSITFQLPALISGKVVHGLTVVISPLQSLMKDQVDNLHQTGVDEAVTVNGLLDPIERASSIERLRDGSANLLYISPEQLRSRTIEKILTTRNVVRFVIDEAHCFSSWGQDFRVDYLYIGDFIRKLQKLKGNNISIPVSCFTATAKQKVISDICQYFKDKLGLELELFTSKASRSNLHYTVLYQENDEAKYNTLRNLISEKECPTILYVSRTKTTVMLADKLTQDGFPSRAFHGQMESTEKIQNQEDFIQNKVRIMVATSAFGMGVDKKDVQLVIHYDISDSLENYVQEAGRAGRDPNTQAECYILFNNSDLEQHFSLLHQTKLSINEIQQVWKSVKGLTKHRSAVKCSALEIARRAGWDDSVRDIETKVKTAISALENSGYVQRGNNIPHIYATSILAKNMQEASSRIDNSTLFSDNEKLQAKQIIKYLISSRSIAKAGNDEAESRIDYLADTLGITKQEVIRSINLMRQEGLLADTQDLSAYIYTSDNENKSLQLLKRFAEIEKYILQYFDENGCNNTLKEINDSAMKNGLTFSSVKKIRTLLYYLLIKKYIVKEEDNTHHFPEKTDIDFLLKKHDNRISICNFILKYLYENAKNSQMDKEEKLIQFSVVEILNKYKEKHEYQPILAEIEDALLYLSKIEAIKIEGGFLVIYNSMEINRIIMDNKIRYKVDDYRAMDEFYEQRKYQIHIVGEYATMMIKDHDAALQFVQDYFQMDFRKFLTKYFKGERAKEIGLNITPQRYHKIFGELSDIQSKIIQNSDSKYIVVAAGPGSGKTRVLVHKLASLLSLEDVKSQQLLMLTFSRAAATEFKQRLIDLIGNAAYFVEIKTFHSYCFDLLGKIGSLEGSENVVREAAQMIENGEVEQEKITKSVLVIDEAQDMDKDEFDLVKALIKQNDDMRIIAVGDDDQNIYEFRNSSSEYMRSLIEYYGAVKYEMIENYRSTKEIVDFANQFVRLIQNRMKVDTIHPVSQEKGMVTVISHQCNSMCQAVAEQVEQHIKENAVSGTTCILTLTNEEAMQIQSLLICKGIHAKLIQSVNEVKFGDIMEVRHILTLIKRRITSPVISDAIWNDVRGFIENKYRTSACLENVMNMMDTFQSVCSEKYFSDFKEFIAESKFEDFYKSDNNTIYISTIHKSKGREFDNVYMMLSDIKMIADNAGKRLVYVGMTRAKSKLFIHADEYICKELNIAENIQTDERKYPEPDELHLQMTHRDVVLDFFEGKKRILFELRSGQELHIWEDYLTADIGDTTYAVAKFSKKFREELQKYSLKKYMPVSAKVQFIAAWSNDRHPEPLPVVLADIVLKK